jgi:Mrp family chromosome partitioning ATPase
MPEQRETVEGVMEGTLAKPMSQYRDGGAYGAEAEEPGAGQLLLWLHMMLRGRYVWLVILGLLLGGAMGYGGFRLGYKTYRSTGLIQIVKPLKVTQGVEDETAADLEGFASTQAGLLKSSPVIAMALQDSAWTALKHKSTTTPEEDFAQALTVVPKDRMIYVTFEDRDPNAAGVGMKALLSAYKQMYLGQDQAAKNARMALLTERATNLGYDDSAKKNQIATIAEKYGTTDIGSVYQTKQEAANRLLQLKQELDLRVDMASSPSTTRPVENSPELKSLLNRMDIEDLAQKDSTLRDMLSERSSTERSLRDLMAVNGYGETHPRVQATKKKLDILETDIAARAGKVREMLKRLPPTLASGGTLSVEELKRRQILLQAQWTAAADEALKVGQLNLQMQNLQEERTAIRQQLDSLKKWIDDLNLQQREDQRIRILSDGTTPASAQSDTRVRFAAMGGMLGIMVAFGLVLLPGVTDRTFKAADETKLAGYLGPVLGVLPELPGDMFDDENAAMAAHCVHQTRTLLQMRHTGNHGQVLAVTSSLAGTGKTSLTLALGVSFATAGSRTLIIDCDLVGGGLSARVSRMMRRKIGFLLRREGLINDEQLSQALALSKSTRRPLGETCVEMGYVTELDVQRVLATQDGAHMGVLDALSGESLEECVAETGFPGLSILPLGTASARHCASLSPAALRRLLKVARGRYDTVLIDTGPVPGSLEASVVVPEAGGVVLVVSKGEPKSSVARCAEHLRSLNATPMGVVFNRASVKEISHNSSTLHRSAAAFSASSSGLGLRVDPEQSRRSNRLGPMAQAVAGCAPKDGGEEA